ncbi:CoA transferase [Tardiphaga alba]|uniref:CoA transferase n=2 Tax=Tardiphaga alba TaxID=340268 RepID=A0ABX8AF76_9BRAD|nr:CoA transferase [Tardiphaga alba]
MMARMLENIRIIDLTTIVFGPYATETLADLGADVIKIEAPSGDMFRNSGASVKTGGMGACHMTLNRGKKSLTLDLKTERDKEKLRELLRTADVFIHNVRKRAIDRLGFGYDAVKAINKDIIYTHCVGFGSGGRYRDLPAYDDVIQAATGTATLLSRVDGQARPRYLPSLIADKVAGLHGTYSVLAALVHKLRTGEGQFVEVPMFESFAHFMLQEHLFGATFKPQAYQMGYTRQLDPERQPFPTADGHISIVLYTDAITEKLLVLFADDRLTNDVRFATKPDRMKNATALYAEIAHRTPAKTTAEWTQLFEVAGIPSMPMHDLEDVLDDPHLDDVNFFAIAQHPTEGRYVSMKAPVSFSARPCTQLDPAPLLGEHDSHLEALLKRS